MRDEITIGTERIRVLTSSAATDGELAVFAIAMPAGGGPAMLHRHEASELYRVRNGELTFYREGRDGTVTRTVVEAGSTAAIRGGLEHTVRNESPAPAEAVVAFAPGAAMERFARAASAAADVLAVAAAHGIEVTRPVADALKAPKRAPYLTLARFPGDRDVLLRGYRGSADTMAAVGRDHGLIAHAAAPTDEGLLVVNLWSSKDGSEAAARDPRRAAVLRRAPVESDQIRREHHEVEKLVMP